MLGNEKWSVYEDQNGCSVPGEMIEYVYPSVVPPGASKLDKVDKELFQKVNKELDESMVIDNYKILCKILKIPSYKSGSNQQKAQLKQLSRYFNYVKDGRRYIITEIYDVPLQSTDKRRNRTKSVYIQFIESILLTHLLNQKGFVDYFTNKSLWRMLGLINSDYQSINLSELQKIDTKITSWQLNNFYNRSWIILQNITDYAIKSLCDRCLIMAEKQIIIKAGSIYREAIETEKQNILDAERKIMNENKWKSKTYLTATGR